MSRVMCAMSGGVDSSVAAALLLDEGHDVVGVTMKLWGGAQDSGCCSVGDVEDARRVAQQLGIPHHVFNFTDDFDALVVAPYVTAHAEGRTPNPCIECNRHLKFDRLVTRARQLGFDAVATGHHARIVDGAVHRGADRAKDQSYVLHMLDRSRLRFLRFPVGSMTKADVRARAATLGLRTADKGESQDTCFITASGGREQFLGARIPLHQGRVVDAAGTLLGSIPAVELVTVGQRRGLGSAGLRRYALDVDVASATVTVGERGDLDTDWIALDPVWSSGVAPEPGTAVEVQTSAHGRPAPGRWMGDGITFDPPVRRPAAGQAVVLYQGDAVLGGAPYRSERPTGAGSGPEGAPEELTAGRSERPTGPGGGPALAADRPWRRTGP
jgi:tRNA-specific 2-thiouridylase